jgi:hypothetical protein
MPHIYKIDKGIEVPGMNRRKGRYPWAELEVGDSFFIPSEEVSDPRSAMFHAGERMGRKFTLRRSKENGVNGARV